MSPIACPDNLGFDSQGRLWIVTDADGDLVANNGCYVVPTNGPDRGHLQQIASAPVGAEVCGCEFTPDGRTLFLSIQHPGEGGTVDAPVSHWPDGGVLRDLVCNEIPQLFSDHRPYAICAAAGGVSYTIFAILDTPSWWAMTACALTTTGCRALAVVFDFKLPAIGDR